LFVLFHDAVQEEDIALTRGVSQGSDGVPSPKASGQQAGASFAPGGVAFCKSGKLLKALALLGAAALLSTVGYAVSRARPTRGQGSAADAVNEDIVLGSGELPEDLDPAPQPEISQIGHTLHCSYQTTDRCPVSQLFFNADLHEVATENLMQVGRGLFRHADRDLVRDTVAAGFKQISQQLEEHAPAAFQALTQIKLEAKDTNAVLSWLRLTSVPEVQSIGFEVALAVRRSLTVNRAKVRAQIEGILQMNLDKIKDLRDELLPPSVLKFLGSSNQWEMTLEEENLQVMEAHHNDGEFYGSLSAEFYSENRSGAPKKLPAEEKAYGAWGGVLEQGRVFIDIIKLVSAAHGVELLVPPQATALAANIDVKDLGSELLSCELYQDDGMNNFMKALFCPLKYGSQGLDAFRAVHAMQAPLAA
jgi:hypothetical protein